MTDPDSTYTSAQQQRILTIARAAVTDALHGRKPDQRAGPDDAYLLEPRGCFVTLHDRAGELRGCIGTFEASHPLIDNLIQMAAAATRDPRFTESPVIAAELGDLAIEVSILTPLEPLDDARKFQAGVDGLYITGQRHGRNVSGCFLPQVATEMGWDAELTLSMCCAHKMGLDPDAWRPPTALKFHRFRSIIINEPHPAGP